MNVPGVNVVAVCPNLEIRNALIRAIQKTGNISPELKSDSQEVKRALYAPAMTRLIINTASDKIRKVLGYPSVALAVEVFNQVKAAQQARSMLDRLV